jgi:16S rRNA (adenine1518-N6/adenine1519-N6)-dimethyltransferase
MCPRNSLEVEQHLVKTGKRMDKKPNPTRAILREYGYQPNKRRGQNFLVREAMLQSIAEAARLSATDVVLEIGPGPGNLTRHLVRSAGRVIAVEVEHELASIVRAELASDNLTVLEADALSLDFAALTPPGGKLKLVANLPFNITTPMLFKILEDPTLFSQVLLLIQKEVAERIIAPAGQKPYGILAVQTQLRCDAEIALTIGPEAFSPRPKVASALIRLTPLPAPRAPVTDLDRFRRLVRAAFAQRRKTLRNSLLAALDGFTPEQIDQALAQTEIDPRRRAETLSIEEFAALENKLSLDLS